MISKHKNEAQNGALSQNMLFYDILEIMSLLQNERFVLVYRYVVPEI